MKRTASNAHALCRLTRACAVAALGLGILAGTATPAALAAPYGTLPSPIAVTEAPEAAPNLADSAADTAPVEQAADYVGWWCPADEAASVVAVDGKAYQLQIVGQTDDYLVLNIMYTTSGAEVGSANAMGTLVAPLSDGSAAFSLCDGQGRIYDATIDLTDEDAIDVSIVQTDAYQSTSPYDSASLAVDGTFARDAHHGAKTDSIGWMGSQLQPSSSWEPLNEEMLVYASPLVLELTRNEIYARHGYVFDTDYLAQYFSSKNWYEPLASADDFDEASLNDIERANVELLQRIQQRWESMSNGTTFVGTSGSYAVGYYGADGADIPGSPAVEVGFDEPGTVTFAFADQDGAPSIGTFTARIADDSTAVFDVEGGQIVATWSGPGYFFFSWRGEGAAPDSWASIAYQSFRNDAYVAVG